MRDHLKRLLYIAIEKNKNKNILEQFSRVFLIVM